MAPGYAAGMTTEPHSGRYHFGFALRVYDAVAEHRLCWTGVLLGYVYTYGYACYRIGSWCYLGNASAETVGLPDYSRVADSRFLFHVFQHPLGRDDPLWVYSG